MIFMASEAIRAATTKPDADQAAQLPETDISKIVPKPRDLEADREALKGEGQKGFPQSWAALTGKEPSAFDPVLMTYLNKFEIVDEQTADGGMLVRLEGNDKYGFDVSPAGVDLAGLSDEEMLTDKGLEAMLEGALLAKTLPDAAPDGQGILAYHQNPEIQMALVKAGQLADLNIKNVNGPTLDEKNPELAKRLEQAWERVQARHEGVAPAEPQKPAFGVADPSADATADNNATTQQPSVATPGSTWT